MKHSVLITEENADVKKLKTICGRPEFSSVDGIGSLDSLYQASDAIIAVAGFFDDQLVTMGSGVMIGPGLMLTATHVLDEFPRDGSGPIFLTFLPGSSARAWLPNDVAVASGPSEFRTAGKDRRKVSDIALISCALHSDAHLGHELSLVPIEVCLPLPAERLWAVGFKHGTVEEDTQGLIPMVTSGLVTECFVKGRGERMASTCIEVSMETVGGLSGGPVFNKDGQVVGIVSSSFEGGPTYVTLVWDALRLSVKSPQKGVWPCSTLDLLKGRDLGLVTIKGQVERKKGSKDIILNLTGKAIEIVASQSADQIETKDRNSR